MEGSDNMYWQSLNMTSFQSVVKGAPTVVLPIGMTEAHGPHCPLGTDNIMPEEICRRIENLLGPQVLIAPAVPYGHSWSLGPFPGTIDIPAAVLNDYVLAIGRGFLKHGLKRIVFLNGHGGNIPTLTTAAEMLADEGAAVLLSNWWLDYSAEILKICEGQGHAGEDETAVMLALVPELVDMPKAKANISPRRANIKAQSLRMDQFAHAMTGDSTKATVEKGQRIIDVVCQNIVTLIREFSELF